MLRWSSLVVNDQFTSLSKNARLTWMALCVFTKWNKDLKHGECWPSISTLARFTGFGVTTIKLGLRELIDCGMLQKAGRTGGKLVNRYVMTPENYHSRNAASRVTTGASRVTTGDSRVATGGSRTATGGSRVATGGSRNAASDRSPDDHTMVATRPPAGRHASTNNTKNITKNIPENITMNTPIEQTGGSTYETVARRLMDGILEAEFHD